MNTPDFSQTTLEAAMANTLAAVKIQVDQFNEQVKANYLTSFDNEEHSIGGARTQRSGEWRKAFGGHYR